MLREPRPFEKKRRARDSIFQIRARVGGHRWGSLCTKTAQGLIACFVAAIPFFHTMLLGTLVYSAFLFGGFILAKRAFPRLREPAYGLSA